MTISMREKIAKAIYEQRNGAGAMPWLRRDWRHKQSYYGDADAALDALMDPTGVVVEAGTDRDDGADPTNALGVFRAMIKAAKEGGG